MEVKKASGSQSCPSAPLFHCRVFPFSWRFRFPQQIPLVWQKQTPEAAAKVARKAFRNFDSPRAKYGRTTCTVKNRFVEYFYRQSNIRRGASFATWEIRRFERRVSEMEIQEIIYFEVLNCLVRLRGAAYNQIDVEYYSEHPYAVTVLQNLPKMISQITSNEQNIFAQIFWISDHGFLQR